MFCSFFFSLLFFERNLGSSFFSTGSSPTFLDKIFVLFSSFFSSSSFSFSTSSFFLLFLFSFCLSFFSSVLLDSSFSFESFTTLSQLPSSGFLFPILSHITLSFSFSFLSLILFGSSLCLDYLSKSSINSTSLV